MDLENMQQYSSDYGDLYKNFAYTKIVFDNEEKIEINMDELHEGFVKEVDYSRYHHGLRIQIIGDSILIGFTEKAPGLACTCCNGSGRKQDSSGLL